MTAGQVEGGVHAWDTIKALHGEPFTDCSETDRFLRKVQRLCGALSLNYFNIVSQGIDDCKGYKGPHTRSGCLQAA